MCDEYDDLSRRPVPHAACSAEPNFGFASRTYGVKKPVNEAKRPGRVTRPL
jgi:hypothetical protein